MKECADLRTTMVHYSAVCHPRSKKLIRLYGENLNADRRNRLLRQLERNNDCRTYNSGLQKFAILIENFEHDPTDYCHYHC